MAKTPVVLVGEKIHYKNCPFPAGLWCLISSVPLFDFVCALALAIKHFGCFMALPFNLAFVRKAFKEFCCLSQEQNNHMKLQTLPSPVPSSD